MSRIIADTAHILSRILKNTAHYYMWLGLQGRFDFDLGQDSGDAGSSDTRIIG